MMRRSLSLSWQGFLALLGFGALATPALAATPLGSLHVSPGTAILLGGSLIGAEGVAQVVPVAAPPPEVDLGSPTAPANVTAYHDAGEGVHWFSLETTTALGGVTISPRDVASYDTGTTTHAIEFAGAAAGLPDGVRIDALSRNSSNYLLLSFDISVALPGAIHVDDEDLVAWDGANFTLAWDGSAAGVGEGLDVDGVADLHSGNLLISFDTSGSLSGITFDDEDILEVDTATSSWQMAWDGSASDAVWAASDLAALDAPADSDGDGVADGEDAFPSDPGESVDTDSDGVGNNADPEDDGDGILDSVEDAGPNAGDANADGTADSLQPEVASLPDLGGTDYVVVVLTGGCDEVQSVSVADEASMGQADAGFDYPLGLVSFTLPCAAADVKIYFFSTTPVAAEYRKYGPTTPGDSGTNAWYSLPGATFGSETIAGGSVTTASFTLQDGQLGDATGVDGQIVDPGGPPASETSSVPALPPLGIALLMAGLLGVGAGRLGWLPECFENYGDS